MTNAPDLHALAIVQRLAVDAPGLRLLVLFGSRARGAAHPHSDWDFAFTADPTFDPDILAARLAEVLAADRIDLVDLDRASAVLRYEVAAHGVVVREEQPHGFDQFKLDAITTWCDLAPVLEPAYDAKLKRLRA